MKMTSDHGNENFVIRVNEVFFNTDSSCEYVYHLPRTCCLYAYCSMTILKYISTKRQLSVKKRESAKLKDRAENAKPRPMDQQQIHISVVVLFVLCLGV